MHASDLNSALAEKAMGLTWYHTFTLPGGKPVRGHPFSNGTVTLKAMQGVDFTGLRCVDLGTMDGAFALWMKRRGAGDVVAFDRMNRAEHIAIVHALSGHDFSYVPETPFEAVPRRLYRRWREAADYVHFSGILYHMMDPMRGIGLVRQMTRQGGIAVLETPAIVAPESFMYYNHDFKFYNYGTYFAPSLLCLQEMCRFMGFAIEDAWFVPNGTLMGRPLVRIALALRATRPLTETDAVPGWVTDYTADDLLEVMDIHTLQETSDRPPVPFTPGSGYTTGQSLYDFCLSAPPTEDDQPLLDRLLSL